MSNAKRVVFVVDDEIVIAQTLAVILNQAGFEATAFSHPQQAIQARPDLVPDLLISDVVMPDMTGVELAVDFLEAQPDCKILLFSGQAATANFLQEARDKGYNFELLAKPVHPTDLLSKLRS